MTKRAPRDLLVVVTHHIGELDAYLPLLCLAHERNPSWQATMLFTKRSDLARIEQSPAMLAMLDSCHIKIVGCFVNRFNEALPARPPKSPRLSHNWIEFADRATRRLMTYASALSALPAFIRTIWQHERISVEGTQYGFVPSISCLLGHIFGSRTFLHNHSVQPILSLPKSLPRILGRGHACGIVFSNTDTAKSLFGPSLGGPTYRTGLIKFHPVWVDRCRQKFHRDNGGALVLFGKRIKFEVYTHLLDDLLKALSAEGFDRQIILKPHPADSFSPYQALLTKYPSLRLSISGEPNFALIAQAKMAVCFPGSSILDCDAFGVPAIELRPAVAEFAKGKAVPRDYALSGYPSTAEIGEVIKWIKIHELSDDAAARPSGAGTDDTQKTDCELDTILEVLGVSAPLNLPAPRCNSND